LRRRGAYWGKEEIKCLWEFCWEGEGIGRRGGGEERFYGLTKEKRGFAERTNQQTVVLKKSLKVLRKEKKDHCEDKAGAKSNKK